MPFDGGEARPAAPQPSSLALLVRMPDGGVVFPPAMVGARLQDALAAFGIPIERGDELRTGGAACAQFQRAWSERLPGPTSEEQALLAARGAHDGTKRLIQHIVLTPDLDGLELELSWDALVPQTYWVAG
jgi:hypothetical protein